MQEARPLLRRLALERFKEAGLWRDGDGGEPVICCAPPPVELPGVGALPSYIHKDELARVPARHWQGPTHVVQSVAEARDVVEYIVSELAASADVDDHVLGFDAEFASFRSWPPPPNLIQVCARERTPSWARDPPPRPPSRAPSGRHRVRHRGRAGGLLANGGGADVLRAASSPQGRGTLAL